jgi:hypothetical protein
MCVFRSIIGVDIRRADSVIRRIRTYFQSLRPGYLDTIPAWRDDALPHASFWGNGTPIELYQPNILKNTKSVNIGKI